MAGRNRKGRWMMNCDYVRNYYGVPAEIGRRVSVNGRDGIIAEDRGNHIGVLFDDSNPNQIVPCHPMWKVDYHGLGKVREMTRSQKRYRDFIKADSGLTFAEWIGVA